MNIKRIISTVIGLPLVLILLIIGNKYVVDIAISVIAIMGIHEYFHCFEQKEYHPIKWIGYLAAILIAFIHIIPKEQTLLLIGAIIPISILVMFAKVIASNMKTNIIDVAITFFGICYIILFLMFLSIIREMPNGKFLIWFVFIASWGTDAFAYIFGKAIGKHKFTQVSPNKTIEGCIGGTLGSVVLAVIYAMICNHFTTLEINYIFIAFVTVLLSIVGQIGDLSASSMKRYTGIKDFSNLIPGHGGMLDRLDSVIFIAPFAYFLLTLL